MTIYYPLFGSSRVLAIIAIIASCLAISAVSLIPGEPAVHTYPLWPVWKSQHGHIYLDAWLEWVGELTYSSTVTLLQTLNSDPNKKTWYKINTFADYPAEAWQAWWSGAVWTYTETPQFSTADITSITYDDIMDVVDQYRDEDDMNSEQINQKTEISQDISTINNIDSTNQKNKRARQINKDVDPIKIQSTIEQLQYIIFETAKSTKKDISLEDNTSIDSNNNDNNRDIDSKYRKYDELSQHVYDTSIILQDCLRALNDIQRDLLMKKLTYPIYEAFYDKLMKEREVKQLNRMNKKQKNLNSDKV